ncbi:MAG: methyltransferase [Pseudomonadota bacterium]
MSLGGALAPPGPLARLFRRLRVWRDARLADPAFQAWATRFPLTRPLSNARGQALFDLVAGFTYTQTLLACVQADLFERLRDGPKDFGTLGAETGLGPEALERLVDAAAALDLLDFKGGEVALGPLGAALLGAPGVVEMVRHHPLFYRDLEDPLALISGANRDTELKRYWSYVGGRVGAEAAEYSRLMSATQTMVAAETLAVEAFANARVLMDVGAGNGTFLSAALTRQPRLSGVAFDLPEVARGAARALERFGDRVETIGGSFKDGLPTGADAISLVRVLYDHDRPVVQNLLRAAYEALPPGGTILISEPMKGARKPSRSGDTYFALYTAAMTSGTPRRPQEHMRLLTEAGFASVRLRPARQAFITRVVTARKPL